jgi:chromosome partitioning protein
MTSKAPQKKTLLPFAAFLFNVKQLAETFNISRTIIYQFEKDGVIEGVTVPSGVTEKKVFGWDDVARLGSRLRHRQPTPTSGKIKVFANMKGGVGKSTIAAQFAMRAACCGFKTLLVDLDAQAHATHILGVSEAERESAPTIQDAITGDEPLPIQALIRPITPLLSIIPANLNLSSLDMEMFPLPKREERVGRLLRSIRDEWDFIVVDTAPNASLVTINAILAADEICTVASTEFLAVAGLQKLFRIMRDLEEQFEHSPAVRIIPNLFDVREGHAQEALGVLRQKYGEFLTTTVVRRNVDLKDASKRSHAVWLYNRSSTGAEDVACLTHELIGGEPATRSSEVAA